MTICFSEDTVRPARSGQVGTWTSALKTAAAALGSDEIASWSPGNLTATETHPITSTTGLTIVADGQTNSGTVALGYSGKGAYDPRTHRIMWASSGPNVRSDNGYRYNTHAIYDESADRWFARRGFKVDSTDATEWGLVHTYDSNCIDVVGGKFYKADSLNRLYAYNLASGQADPDGGVDGPTSHSTSFWWPACDWIEKRNGTDGKGAIWWLGWASNNNLQLWEWKLNGTDWTVIKDTAAFGNVSTPSTSAPVMSYNPRAFNGDGGVMIGNEASAWTINCQSLAMTSISPPAGSGTLASSYSSGRSSGFCRDPRSDGWIQLWNGNKAIYNWNGSTWDTATATLPAHFDSTRDFIVTAIDEYGVIAVVSWNSNSPLAWLYKPAA